jgi:hypothetical protein
MPNVILGSVEGTTRIYSIPTVLPAAGGYRPTGTKSKVHLKNTQTKIILNARGATTLLL